MMSSMPSPFTSPALLTDHPNMLLSLEDGPTKVVPCGISGKFFQNRKVRNAPNLFYPKILVLKRVLDKFWIRVFLFQKLSETFSPDYSDMSKFLDFGHVVF